MSHLRIPVLIPLQCSGVIEEGEEVELVGVAILLLSMEGVGVVVAPLLLHNLAQIPLLLAISQFQ